MKKSSHNAVELDIEEINPVHTVLDLSDEDVTVREAHHAMHVLTFFAFLSDLTTHGKLIRQPLIDRVVYHLLNLREYIQDPRMGDIASDLCAAVTVSYDDFFPEGAAQPGNIFCLSQWIDRHEAAILALATHYGKEALFRSSVRAA